MARTAHPGTHEALLEAARAEFARRGLLRGRVEDVARRAGVSKGAFYLHFRSKEDAFREILQRFLGVLEEHIRARREAEERFEALADGATLEEAIDFECEVNVQLLELLWRNRQIVAALEGAGGHAFAPLVADFRRRMRALVAERIATRQRQGGLRRDVRPDVVADLVVAAYEDFGRRMIAMRERPDLASWARSLLVVVYRGILEPPAAARAPGS